MSPAPRLDSMFGAQRPPVPRLHETVDMVDLGDEEKASMRALFKGLNGEGVDAIVDALDSVDGLAKEPVRARGTLETSPPKIVIKTEAGEDVPEIVHGLSKEEQQQRMEAERSLAALQQEMDQAIRAKDTEAYNALFIQGQRLSAELAVLNDLEGRRQELIELKTRKVIHTSDDGKFETINPLGAGGMGDVYVGRQLSARVTGKETAETVPDSREVAVKLLKQTLKPEQRIRFEREALATAAVNHENVVTVIAVGEMEQPGANEASPFIAYELVRGGDAGDRFKNRVKNLDLEDKKQRALLEKEVGIDMLQILAGVSALHAQGVVHRDLKPGNIFVQTGEQGDILKVADLGIARAQREFGDESMQAVDLGALLEGRGIDETLDVGESLLQDNLDLTLTSQGMCLGTPAYGPFEQFMSRGKAPVAADKGVDLYAVGAMAFEALSGNIAYEQQVDGEGAFAFMIAKASYNPITLEETLSAESSPLFKLVDTLIMRDRNERASFTIGEETLSLTTADEVRGAFAYVLARMYPDIAGHREVARAPEPVFLLQNKAERQVAATK